VAELREVLRRGLRRALTGRAAADDGFIEDMTQEGVLKVLGGLTTFRGESRFTTWAITVAVRVAFTELRGMPQAEIAVQMGLTRNALYKLTHDARQKLKRGLEAAGISGDEVRVTFDL
jgi:DNA-directed RNA polymerase specialized sigma24 family protein